MPEELLELEELELLEELEEELEELLELELELLEELLLELEEELLLELPFPPPPPPPQAVSIETDIAAARTAAITFVDNLIVNFLPHFQTTFSKSTAENLVRPLCFSKFTPPCIDLSSSFDEFVLFNIIIPENASI